MCVCSCVCVWNHVSFWELTNMRSGLISTVLLVPVFRLILLLLLVLINVPFLLHNRLSLPFHITSTLTFACFHSMDKNDKYMFAGRDEVDYYNVHQLTYHVSHVVIHEHFNRTTNENDIALLKTSTKISFDTNVGALCFPDADFRLQADKNCLFAGYGDTQG